MPASRRCGICLGVVEAVESTPVPPKRVELRVEVRASTSPPMPVGPSRALWPGEGDRRHSQSRTRSGISPALWAASRTSGTPRARQRAAISATGCTVPSTLRGVVRITSRVAGVTARATASGSTSPRHRTPPGRSRSRRAVPEVVQGPQHRIVLQPRSSRRGRPAAEALDQGVERVGGVGGEDRRASFRRPRRSGPPCGAPPTTAASASTARS